MALGLEKYLERRLRMNTFENEYVYAQGWIKGTKLEMVYERPAAMGRGGLKTTFNRWSVCSPVAQCAQVCRTGNRCFYCSDGSRKCGGKLGDWYWEVISK